MNNLKVLEDNAVIFEKDYTAQPPEPPAKEPDPFDLLTALPWKEYWEKYKIVKYPNTMEGMVAAFKEWKINPTPPEPEPDPFQWEISEPWRLYWEANKGTKYENTQKGLLQAYKDWMAMQ